MTKKPPASSVVIPGTEWSMSVYLGVPNQEVDYFQPSRGWLFAEDCLSSARTASYFKNREKIIRIRCPDELEDSQLQECNRLMMPAFNRGVSNHTPVIEEPVFLAYVKGSPEQTSELAQLFRGMLPQGTQIGVVIGDGHTMRQVGEFMDWASENEFSPLVFGSSLNPYRHVVLPSLPYKEGGWYHLHDPFAQPPDITAMRNAASVRARLTCSWNVQLP